jgi:hypothetical protein
METYTNNSYNDAERKIIEVGNQDITELTDPDDLLLYICWLLRTYPGHGTRDLPNYTNENEFMYYYLYVASLADQPAEKLALLRNFIRQMFITQSDFKIDEEDKYGVEWRPDQEWVSRMSEQYGVELPEFRPNMDSDEKEAYFRAAENLIAEREMWKANATNTSNPYSWAPTMTGNEPKPLSWWRLSPIVYFRESYLDWGSKIGDVPIPPGDYDQKLDPSKQPWKRSSVDPCLEVRNRLRSKLIERQKIGPAPATTDTAALRSPEDAGRTVRISTAVGNTSAEIPPNSIFINSEGETSIPQVVPSASLAERGAVLSRPSEKVRALITEARECAVPACGVCIPYDVLQVLLQHKNHAMLALYEEGSDPSSGLDRYRQMVLRDISDYRKGSPRGENLAALLQEQFGDIYSEGVLGDFLSVWADRPDVVEYYATDADGPCQNPICKSCALRLAKTFTETSTVSGGSLVNYPYFAPLPELSKRELTEGTLTQYVHPTTRQVIRTRVTYYMRPELIEEERRLIEQNPAAYAIPSGTIRYQIPPRWFDYYIGPYALERGSLVYYRHDLAISGIPGDLAIGILQEYDTDLWYYEYYEGTSVDQNGRLPMRAIVTPFVPYLGAAVVESVRLDSIFPMGMQVPTTEEVIRSRGPRTAATRLEIKIPDNMSIQQQIEYIEFALGTGIITNPKDQDRMRAMWRMLQERERLIDTTLTAERVIELNTRIAEEMRRGGSSRVAREQQLVPYRGSRSSREAAISSLKRLGDRPSVQNLSLSQLQSMVDQLEGQTAPSRLDLRGETDDEDDRVLVNDQEKLNIIYRVTAVKWREMYHRTFSSMPSRHDAATVLVASVVGIAIVVGNQEDNSALNQYGQLVLAWNIIFGDVGPSRDRTKWQFPGPEGRPRWKTVGSRQEARTLIMANEKYSALYRKVFKLLDRYTWEYYAGIALYTGVLTDSSESNLLHIRRQYNVLPAPSRGKETPSDIRRMAPPPEPTPVTEHIVPLKSALPPPTSLTVRSTDQQRPQTLEDLMDARLFRMTIEADKPQITFIIPHDPAFQTPEGLWDAQLLSDLTDFYQTQHLPPSDPRRQRMNEIERLISENSTWTKWEGLPKTSLVPVRGSGLPQNRDLLYPPRGRSCSSGV